METSAANLACPPDRGFFVSGGTMPLDSASYIERASDKALFEGLVHGKYCYVLNSRQMGKSSLSVRVLSKLDQAGVKAAFVDLTRIGGRNVTAAQWYAGLCDAVGVSLDLQGEMLDYYRRNSLLSPMQRFFGALEGVALVRIDGPIVIFFDEIDSTKNLPFEADEFFAGIRECYNRRVQNVVFERLSFCLIGVAVPSDLISNPSTTPFNIGERIQLHDFTIGEMQSLAPALGPNGAKLVRRIHHWTGGQPFLSQSLCETVAADPSVQSPEEIDTLVRVRLLERRARTTNINLSDVGDRALNAGSSEPDPAGFRAELLSTYERAWRGDFVPDDESNRVAVILKLCGLMRSDGRRLEVRNRIYRSVFDRKWVAENMPERELLRERRAFRRGILRSASASAAVIAVVGILGLFAWRSERDAVSAKSALDYELYVADMNNMRLLEEIGDISRMEEVLARTSASPYRGFEWSYWLRRIHDSNEEYTFDYTAPGKREEGFVSQDGREICVYDSLLGIAAILDRQTKKVLSTTEVGREARLAATRGGFVNLRFDAKALKVQDVATGQTLCRFAPMDEIAFTPYIRPRSDFCVNLLRSQADHKIHDLVLWDLRTAGARYRMHVAGELSDAPLAVSRNGTRILYGLAGDTEAAPGFSRFRVRDVATDRDLDSFDVPAGSTPADFSESGKLVLLRDARHNTSCRNVDEHKIVFTRAWDGADIPGASAITSDDKAVVEQFASGRATSLDLRQGRTTVLGQHAWTLRLGDVPDRVIAASTSVRILSTQGQDSQLTIAEGGRVGRDNAGQICVFDERPSGIEWYRDSDLKFVRRTPPAPRLRNGYTYNGRWRLSLDPNRKAAFFTDADGIQPPIRLAPVPANFSCGTRRDSLVILAPGGHRIEAISPKTGKPRWTFDVNVDRVTGLWVSPDGTTALVLAGELNLVVLDVATGKLRAILGGHNVRISNVSFTRDSSGFLTSGADGRVILWDLGTLRRLREYRGNVAQRMSSADLSPDGTRVVTSNMAGSWQLWDAKTGVQLMDLQGSVLPIRSILFAADGKTILTAGEDRQVRGWIARAFDPSIRIPVSADILKDIQR